jgi:hypothetical protein
MDPNTDRPSRAFVAASIAITILIVAWFAFAASREWFAGDDFWFLPPAEGPKNWLKIFFPLEPRTWWSYRPISIDVFFWLGVRLFDRNPFGFLAASLSMHLLTGLVVYRLARQLGFEIPVAVVTALFSVSRYPSLTEGLWISVCQYTITIFFYTLSMSLFIDYARSRRVGFLLASCVTLILTLLSNEMGATLAAVVVLTSLHLERFSFSPEYLVRALRRAAPHVIITAAYVVYRTLIIGPAGRSPFYQWVFGWHVIVNYFWSVVFVLGPDRTWLLFGAIPLLAALVAIASSHDARGAVVKPLWATSALTVGWIVAAMSPYVGMPFPYRRFAMSIEVPVCLLFGACFNAFSRVYSRRHRAAVEGGLLAVLMLSLPYGAAWDAASNPRGETAKRLVALVGEQDANLPKGSAVVVRYGAEGLATTAESHEFSARVFLGVVFWSFHAGKELRLYILDASQPWPADLICPPCLILDLKPGLVLEPTVPPPLGIGSPRAALWAPHALRFASSSIATR